MKLAQAGFEDFLAGTGVSRLKGKRDDIKRCILLIQFLTVPDTNKLIVNIKVYKLKLTVRIKLKRPNHNYPSCYLVRRDLTFPVNTTRYIPWVEFMFPSLRFGQLYY